MSGLIAVYDACVLYSAPLRDLLMRLAVTDLFRAKWSADIHEEWMRNVLKDRPDLKREQIERTRELMDSHVLDCLVTGYEGLIEGLHLPDKNDRHVLAAAIRSGAQVIVTFNLSDFPSKALKPHGIEAQHPDEFLLDLIDLAPQVVIGAAKAHRASLKKPPKTVREYLETLDRQQLPGTVAFLGKSASLL